MKSFIRRHLYAGKPRSILLWILLFAFRQQYVQAQCAAAPIAAAACSGGNGAATNGVNINSGNTYWVNTSTTLTSVNLSGGTLRICGDLTVSTLNYNSGYLVVENGGTLSIGALGSTNLNGNIVIINRGSITIPGNITFQNSGNYIYNDLSTSVFTFSGKVTVNSGGLTLINRGVMNITELYYQGAAGSTTAGICLGPQSITAINKLTNLTANSFTFSGAGSACVNVSVSAQLTSALTNSANIHVCQGGSATVTGVGGWGSAQVTSNCNSCASVLPLGVTDLTASDQGSSVQLHWVPAGGLGANGVYYAERSTDGIDFETFASVDADMSGSYTVSDPGLIAPKLYYRVRAVTTGGATMFSQIVLVGLLAAGRFQVFPNPAAPNSAITLVVPSPSAGQARVSLVDMAGQLIGTRDISLTPGDNTLSWRLRSVLAGVYFVRVQMRGGILYARLVVRPN